MKKTNKCVKCGSNEIIKTKYTNIGYAAGFQALNLALFKNCIIEWYICTDCGYIENYIDDPKVAKQVKNKDK